MKMNIPDKIRELAALSDPAEMARVIAEHRERYVIQSADTLFQAEITGNIRYAARSRADFPAVGDWVRFTKMDEQNAIILEVLPRYSVLTRQAVARTGEEQIIAANIDTAFIVQAVGHDFNLNRMERYLSICLAVKIKPVVLITKTDLVEANEVTELTGSIQKRLVGVKVIALSSEDGSGYKSLHAVLEAGKTYCFMGSSGVGKSTVINHLLNKEVMKTAGISTSTNKGRHTTSHRELFVLPNGSMVIDTPGMRELGMTDQTTGIEMTFDQIITLAESCRFSDCTHTGEKGCAVLQAVENGELSEDTYENYLKLKREQEHFSSTVYEKRQKDKSFGKMIKSVLNEKKKNKF